MLRVAEIVGSDLDPDELPAPATRPSIGYAVNEGTDRQIALSLIHI